MKKHTRNYLYPSWIYRVLSLMSSICFCTTLAVNISYLNKKPSQALEESFINQKTDYIQLSKKGYGAYNDWYFNEKEIAEFEKASQTEFIECYDYRLNLFPEQFDITSGYKYYSLFPSSYSEAIQISSINDLPASCKLLEGHLPEKEGEIALTDYQFCSYKYNGYQYKEETIQPKDITMKGLLGKTIDFGYRSGSYQTICGFISTGFDYENSDKFVLQHQNDQNYLINHPSLSTKFLISEPFAKTIKEKNLNSFIYKTSEKITIPMENVVFKNEALGTAESIPYFKVKNDYTSKEAIIIDENTKNGILLPVALFSSLIKNNEALNAKREVTIPKEFTYGATADTKEETTLSDLFENYFDSAIKYYVDKTYEDFYSSSPSSSIEYYAKIYFKTESIKPISEWTANEKKEVLKLYIKNNYFQSNQEETYLNTAYDSILDYSKRYISHFYDQYKDEIIKDKSIYIGRDNNYAAYFIFNGFNLSTSEVVLVDEEDMPKLSDEAGNYYSSIIAKTENANLDALFSCCYDKAGKDRYYVRNANENIESFRSYITNKKILTAWLTGLFAALAILFITLDMFYEKQKNIHKLYDIAKGEHSTKTYIKLSAYNSLISYSLIWPISMLCYELMTLIISHYSSMMPLQFNPIIILYLFLMSLLLVLFSFVIRLSFMLHIQRTQNIVQDLKEESNN